MEWLLLTSGAQVSSGRDTPSKARRDISYWSIMSEPDLLWAESKERKYLVIAPRGSVVLLLPRWATRVTRCDDMLVFSSDGNDAVPNDALYITPRCIKVWCGAKPKELPLVRRKGFKCSLEGIGDIIFASRPEGHLCEYEDVEEGGEKWFAYQHLESKLMRMLLALNL